MLKCTKVTADNAGVKKSRPPPGVPSARYRGAGGIGAGGELGWYRGEHAGWINAILMLQKMGHKRIAAKLQKHYGLNDRGAIEL